MRLVRAMCGVIRHRGPDDEGVYVEPGVGLGMRRLSIIDLSTGHQPIHNEDGAVWVVFNGEIYNFRELRGELEAAGHRFYTSSDTETIVHAYEEWGGGVSRGCAACSASRSGIAAPARSGSPAIARASSRCTTPSRRPPLLRVRAKSLLAAGAVDRAIDLEALDHYLSFLYTPRDRAIFKGVRKLPPGHFSAGATGTRRDGTGKLPPEPSAVDDDGSRGAAAARLPDAVRSHLVSDVPLGAFLSGGVDSSLVVALMAEASAGR